MKTLICSLIFLVSNSFLISQNAFEYGVDGLFWGESRKEIISKINKLKSIKKEKLVSNEESRLMYSGGTFLNLKAESKVLFFNSISQFHCFHVELFTPKKNGTYRFYLSLKKLFIDEYGKPDYDENTDTDDRLSEYESKWSIQDNIKILLSINITSYVAIEIWDDRLKD